MDSPRPAHLLVVDDEQMLLDMVSDALRFAGYEVRSADNGETALRVVREEPIDLVILDVNMPGLDGFDVARRFREDGGDVPVIFLTARADADDVREGFETGGDDYLTKPFRLEELRLRVEAVLRRTKPPSTESHRLHCDDLALDDDTHHVTRGDEEVDLSPTEYRLLRYLLQNQGLVLSKAQILQAVWGYGYGDTVVETYVSQLRKKLEAEGPRLIQTVRGFGYTLRPPDS